MIAICYGGRLVAKLRVARECEGRRSYADAMPQTVALAKQLRAEGPSYRKIATALAGHVTRSGRAHVASAIQKMLAG